MRVRTAMAVAVRFLRKHYLSLASGFSGIVLIELFILFVNRCVLTCSYIVENSSSAMILLVSQLVDLSSSTEIINRAHALQQVPITPNVLLGLFARIISVFGPLSTFFALQLVSVGSFGVVWVMLFITHSVFFVRLRHVSGQVQKFSAVVIIMVGGNEQWLYSLFRDLKLIKQPLYYREYWETISTSLSSSLIVGSPILDALIDPTRNIIVGVWVIIGACLVIALQKVSVVRYASWIMVALITCLFVENLSRYLGIVGIGIIVVVICINKRLSSAHAVARTGLIVLSSIMIFVMTLHSSSRFDDNPAWEFWFDRGDVARDVLFLVYDIHIPFVLLGLMLWLSARRLGVASYLNGHSRSILTLICIVHLFLGTVGSRLGIKSFDCGAITSFFAMFLYLDVVLVLYNNKNRVGRLWKYVISSVVVVHMLGLLIASFMALYNTREDGTQNRLDEGVIRVLNSSESNPLVLVPNEKIAKELLIRTKSRVTLGWMTGSKGLVQSFVDQFYSPETSNERRSELARAMGVDYVAEFVDSELFFGVPLELDVFSEVNGLRWYSVRRPIVTKVNVVRGDLVASEFGDVYLFDGRHRRWIPNIEVFMALGYEWDKVKKVDSWSLSDIPEGFPINRHRR